MKVISRGLALTATLALSGALASAGAQSFYTGQDLKWAPSGVLAGSNSLAARNAFIANLTGVGTENFEGFANGAPTPINLTFPGAGTASLTPAGFSVTSATGSGRKATSGSKYLEVATGNGGSQFTIKFSQAIAAFGVYGIDVGDFGDQLTMSFFKNNVAAGTWSPVHGLGGGAGGANDGNLNFFGYINTVNLFDEIRFSSVNAIPNANEDFWGFDDMTIGSVEQVTTTAPEPSSVALIAVGLAGVVAARRRRQSATQA